MLSPNVDGASLIQRGINCCHIHCPTLPLHDTVPGRSDKRHRSLHNGKPSPFVTLFVILKTESNNTDLENDTLKNGGLLCQISAKPTVSEDAVVRGEKDNFRDMSAFQGLK